MKISCEKELGEWTIRVNGIFIISFENGIWSDKKAKARALETAWRLRNATEGKS